ncbi:MAG: YggS family pyridoxal phosphate-dependent enzyme [bacterium]
MYVSENLRRVKDRIEKACQRSGRRVEEIQIVAVSKTVDVARINEAIESGIQIIGENRVQEAWRKFQAIGSKVRWHMVGHLQTNKVKRVLQFVDMIQSVDSIHLAQEIQRQAEKLSRTVDVLVEVNTSGEATKFGFLPNNTVAAVEEIASFSRLNIEGLMTIGVFSPNPEDVRPCFKLLRNLKDEVMNKEIDRVQMRILSMGMTDDFEVAIEEGSNMVRIGRAIFGERPE